MRLTPRDGEIFRFLLDQKFASLEAIYLRFFDRRSYLTDPLPNEFYVTRQRLGLLTKEGLLKTERIYTESKSLYLLGNNGYLYLKEFGAEAPYAIPVKSVDFRNYLHDLRVTYCRIALERARRAIKWYAERRIRMKGYEVKGRQLFESVIPDGVFISSKGQRVAFELECSDRKLSRFETKASEYENLLSNGYVDRVLWIACDALIHKALTKCAGRDDRFTLGTYQEFHKQLFPGVS